MKVGIIIGHYKKGKGAYSDFFGKNEFDFYKDLENDLSLLGDIFYHKNVPSYSVRQKLMAYKTKNYDIVFEMHFNALNEKASGCECLYYNNNSIAWELSDHFTEQYTKLSKTYKRPSKGLKKGDRGYSFVSSQKPLALLIEPFFGDNEDDCKAFNSDYLLHAMNSVIQKYKLLCLK